MNLFFTIHFPLHLRTAGRLCHGDSHGIDAAKTADGFQQFVDRRFFPWIKSVQHLLRMDAFRLRVCITGTVLELFQDYNPEAFIALKALVQNRNVDLVEITYYHSLCRLFSEEEYQLQLRMHRCKIQVVFEKIPVAVSSKGETDKLSPSAVKLAERLFNLEAQVKAVNDENILLRWRLLQELWYYTTAAKDTLLYKHLTDLEASLLQRRLSRIRFAHPVHTFLL